MYCISTYYPILAQCQNLHSELGTRQNVTAVFTEMQSLSFDTFTLTLLEGIMSKKQKQKKHITMGTNLPKCSPVMYTVYFQEILIKYSVKFNSTLRFTGLLQRTGIKTHLRLNANLFIKTNNIYK